MLKPRSSISLLLPPPTFQNPESVSKPALPFASTSCICELQRGCAKRSEARVSISARPASPWCARVCLKDRRPFSYASSSESKRARGHRDSSRTAHERHFFGRNAIISLETKAAVNVKHVAHCVIVVLVSAAQTQTVIELLVTLREEGHQLLHTQSYANEVASASTQYELRFADCFSILDALPHFAVAGPKVSKLLLYDSRVDVPHYLQPPSKDISRPIYDFDVLSLLDL